MVFVFFVFKLRAAELGQYRKAMIELRTRFTRCSFTFGQPFRPGYGSGGYTRMLGYVFMVAPTVHPLAQTESSHTQIPKIFFVS